MIKILIREIDYLNGLLNKYSKVVKKCSRHKYNFIVELINNVNFKLYFEFTQQERLHSSGTIPILKLKNNIAKTVDISNFHFLINDAFKTDIRYLFIRHKDNISSIYNGLVLDLNNFTIACKPPKSYIYSKLSTLKKYDDRDILYEYDIYKLYDGVHVTLYYDKYDASWVLSNIDSININDRILDKINNDTHMSFFNKMMKYYGINIDTFKTNHSYSFFLINTNYNLTSQKDKVKFISCTENVEPEILIPIKIKQLYSMYAKSDYGLILKSKNELDDRIVVFDMYQKIKKIIYEPINNKQLQTPDLKFITIRAILKYRISKTDVFNTYKFLIKYYKYIMTEIDSIIDTYLDEFPCFNKCTSKHRAFIIKMDNEIKSHKILNNIFYDNYVLHDAKDDISIYRLTLRDFITQQKFILDLYNTIV